MKVLFIGGNGNISWHCVQEAINKGYTVYELNREETLSTRREIQPEVIKLKGDMRNHNEIEKLLEGLYFDCVVDFICYDEEHAKFDIELFKDKTKQFIFISTIAVYKRKPSYLPFKENTPKWDDEKYNYAFGKIKSEQIFMNAFEKYNFPITIVRPTHTYDTIVPVSIGHNCFTAPQRYLDGKSILIAGDGTNIWTITHSKDFASAFINLVGNKEAIGEDFHIAGDEVLNWLEITQHIIDALKIKKPKFIHIPLDELINTYLPSSKNLKILGCFGNNFVAYRMWCDIYDNSKIKKISPNWKQKILFKDGIKETINWLNEKDVRRRVNQELYELLDKLEDKYKQYEVNELYIIK